MGLQSKDFDFEKLNCLERKVERARSASLKQSSLDKFFQKWMFLVSRLHVDDDTATFLMLLSLMNKVGPLLG